MRLYLCSCYLVIAATDKINTIPVKGLMDELCLKTFFPQFKSQKHLLCLDFTILTHYSCQVYMKNTTTLLKDTQSCKKKPKTTVFIS